MNQNIELGCTYKHFSGNTYRVLFFGTDAKTQEDIVIYLGLYSPYTIWTRPLKEFKEYLKDRKIFRFTKIIEIK